MAHQEAIARTAVHQTAVSSEVADDGVLFCHDPHPIDHQQQLWLFFSLGIKTIVMVEANWKQESTSQKLKPLYYIIIKIKSYNLYQPSIKAD